MFHNCAGQSRSANCEFVCPGLDNSPAQPCHAASPNTLQLQPALPGHCFSLPRPCQQDLLRLRAAPAKLTAVASAIAWPLPQSSCCRQAAATGRRCLLRRLRSRRCPAICTGEHCCPSHRQPSAQCQARRSAASAMRHTKSTTVLHNSWSVGLHI